MIKEEPNLSPSQKGGVAKFVLENGRRNMDYIFQEPRKRT